MPSQFEKLRPNKPLSFNGCILALLAFETGGISWKLSFRLNHRRTALNIRILVTGIAAAQSSLDLLVNDRVKPIVVPKGSTWAFLVG